MPNFIIARSAEQQANWEALLASSKRGIETSPSGAGELIPATAETPKPKRVRRTTSKPKAKPKAKTEQAVA